MKLFQPRMFRRTLVSGLAAAGAMPAHAASPARPRALALIGDRYHNPDYIRVGLDRLFQELDIAIDYTIDYAALSAVSLKPYRLLLGLRDGMIWPGGYAGPDAYTYETELENAGDFPLAKPVSWMTEEQGLEIQNFVAAGGGFYPLHNSSHISLSSKNYRDVMGGAYFGHPPLRPFQVHATANAHSITAGMQPFVVNDEQHYVDYDKDPKYVILESENLDGLTYEGRGTKSPAGWAYDYGKGRVVFTAVGHTIHAMWNPQYVELQKRSIRWLLKDL